MTKDFDCTLAEKSPFVTIFSLCLSMFIYQYCRCCAANIDYTPSGDAEISVRYSVFPSLLYFKLMQATDLDTIHKIGLTHWHLTSRALSLQCMTKQCLSEKHLNEDIFESLSTMTVC